MFAFTAKLLFMIPLPELEFSKRKPYILQAALIKMGAYLLSVHFIVTRLLLVACNVTADLICMCAI